MRQLFKKDKGEEHNFWMSYTDLLSGFLIVFIIIGVVAYNKLSKTREEYDRLCNILKVENPDSLKNYIGKLEEFVDSINKSNLKNRIYDYKEIFTSTSDIKVVFDSIRGSIILTHQDAEQDLFEKGKSVPNKCLIDYLNQRRKAIVEKTQNIWSNGNANNVELRIEGHTDPDGIYDKTYHYTPDRGSDESFIQNLTLSSERANVVYQEILNGDDLSLEQRDFVKRNMISVGYSFSHRVQQNDIEIVAHDASSRRIEFRIISK